MFATYSRYANNSDEFGKIPIPNMPFVNTFVNQGLNTRPTFLGCDSTTDVTNADSSTTLAPIIAYIPNYPWSFLSNLSSLQFGVSNEVSQATLDNAFESATMGGITSGSQIDWPTCLACASLQRSFERSKTDIPEKCQICMNFYCWNGDTNNTAPTAYSPSIGTPQWVVDNAKSPPSNATIIQVSSAASLFSSDYQSWDTHLLVLLFASFCLLL
jgi:lysophospholipase